MSDTPTQFASLTIPDGVVAPEAYARCSHLAIGAHQDDLEFMAFHGINTCYGDDRLWFGGVTCTDGGGSARAGKYADYTDAQMKAVRMDEQRQAAEIGKYSFVHQLSLSSATIKDPDQRSTLVDQLETILLQTQPDVLYTHNPADKPLTSRSASRYSKPCAACRPTPAPKKCTAAKSGATSTGSATRIKSRST
jgi:LmbE family N-acetylglucosaminyl deacetylase